MGSGVTVASVLDEHGIKYYRDGTNVAKGWIGVTCPFCSDTTNHMGFNLTDHYYSCWKCNAKGRNFLYVVSVMIGVKFSDLLKKYPEIEKQIKLGFTGGAIPNFTIHSLLHKMAYDYLSSDSRKFTHSDILSLEKDYKISYILEGSYSNRLFIPLIEDGIDVNFLTRSVSGDEVRYLNANEQQCIKPLSSCIYGIDELMRIDRGDFLFLQEGVFDALKINLSYVDTKCFSIPMLKKILPSEFSRNSDLMKISTKFNKVIIMLDYGEISSAYLLYSNLSSIIPNLSIHFLPENIKDIGSLSSQEVVQFINSVKQSI